MIDSRVCLGAAAKGRSSSEALSRILQGSLGYILGGGLYPGGLHVYSGDNRGDEPSRDKPMRGPTKATPRWLTDLDRGSYDRFDIVLASAQVPKIYGRWMRLFLLLGRDIEPYPGPAVTPRKPRGELDMAIGFCPKLQTLC